MKIRIINKPKFDLTLKKGCFYQVIDSFDKYSGIYQVTEMNEENIHLYNIKTFTALHISVNDTKLIERLDFKEGKLVFEQPYFKTSESIKKEIKDEKEEKKQSEKKLALDALNEFFHDIMGIPQDCKIDEETLKKIKQGNPLTLLLEQRR